MSKPTIICVDDENTILSSLKKELKRTLGYQYTIETTEDGYDALELIDELLDHGDDIVLVISDYVMPNIKGDELLKRIHTISPQTLNIMLTGQATIEAVQNAVNNAKLYRYLTKPWDSGDLRLTVTEAIRSYSQNKTLAEQNRQFKRMNQELEQLNLQQNTLITQLQENEKRLTQFLEAMPVGVFVTDASGQPYYANQTAQHILGKGVVSSVSSEQFAAIYQAYLANTDQLYPSDQMPLMQALQGKSTTVNDMEIHHPDRIISLEVSGTPIFDETGKTIYAITTFQDITERLKRDQ